MTTSDDIQRTRRLHSQAIWFLLVTFAGATAIALLLPGTKENPGPAPLFSLLMPAVAVGIVMLIATRRDDAPTGPTFGLRTLALRYWPAAIVLPLAAIGGSLAIAHLFGVVDFHDLTGYAASAPIDLAVMTVLLLGEELGWRGFLLPRMNLSMEPRRAAMVVGLIHGLFHVPLLVLTNSYDSDGSRWLVVPGVVTVIALGGATFGWLRTRSGSLWPVLIAHAMVNVCLLESPTLVTDRPNVAALLTSEGGLLTVLTVGAMALCLLRFAPWSQRTTTNRATNPATSPVETAELVDA
ncbi:MAG: hypothetical protein JWN99_2268 [Ilumatobacteraceae bacterium]|nr:hypothetical protein [Ilumatobacteraceae bacterium]